jgi:hypothetical protein
VFGRKDGTVVVFTANVDANSAELQVEASKPESAGDVILSGERTPDGKGLYLGRRTSARSRQTSGWKGVRPIVSVPRRGTHAAGRYEAPG